MPRQHNRQRLSGRPFRVAMMRLLVGCILLMAACSFAQTKGVEDGLLRNQLSLVVHEAAWLQPASS